MTTGKQRIAIRYKNQAAKKQAKRAAIQRQIDSGELVERRLGARKAFKQHVCPKCEWYIEPGEECFSTEDGLVHALCAPLKGQ